ncbi:DUF2283 domain-containing protein [bacterium]|nr:DUF2283 domain-containing protein [bacterium]
MAKSEFADLRISYDNTSDVLYISFGEPQFGIDEEIDNGVYLRVNPQTSKPNGLMIIDFEKRFSEKINIPIHLSNVLVACEHVN